MKIIQLRSFAALICCTVLALAGPALAGDQHDVPSVDGGAGACQATFTVHDGSGKPIYNAQIAVTVRYGFMNLHKTELQVGTNGDGKARVTGLPNFPKKPLVFDISSGTVSREITDDPATNCHASFDVTLTVH